MFTQATEDSIRRVRSLCGSLECILICVETVEQNASHIGSALFLTAELKDAIEQFENAARAGRHKVKWRTISKSARLRKLCSKFYNSVHLSVVDEAA